MNPLEGVFPSPDTWAFWVFWGAVVGGALMGALLMFGRD